MATSDSTVRRWFSWLCSLHMLCHGAAIISAIFRGEILILALLGTGFTAILVAAAIILGMVVIEAQAETRESPKESKPTRRNPSSN